MSQSIIGDEAMKKSKGKKPRLTLYYGKTLEDTRMFVGTRGAVERRLERLKNLSDYDVTVVDSFGKLISGEILATIDDRRKEQERAERDRLYREYQENMESTFYEQAKQTLLKSTYRDLPESGSKYDHQAAKSILYEQGWRFVTDNTATDMKGYLCGWWINPSLPERGAMSLCRPMGDSKHIGRGAYDTYRLHVAPPGYPRS